MEPTGIVLVDEDGIEFYCRNQRLEATCLLDLARATTALEPVVSTEIWDDQLCSFRVLSGTELDEEPTEPLPVGDPTTELAPMLGEVAAPPVRTLPDSLARHLGSLVVDDGSVF